MNKDLEKEIKLSLKNKNPDLAIKILDSVIYNESIEQFTKDYENKINWKDLILGFIAGGGIIGLIGFILGGIL